MTDEHPAPPRGRRGRLYLRPEPGAPCGPWNRRSASAALTLASGLASIVTGSFANVVGWLNGRAGYGPLLTRVGTALLVVSIPLLAAGAHCLDLEDSSAAARHARESSAGAGKGGGR